MTLYLELNRKRYALDGKTTATIATMVTEITLKQASAPK